MAYRYITEEAYRRKYDYWEEQVLEDRIASGNREQGLLEDSVQLYGMEPFILDQLEVLEGDLSKIYGEGNYVAVPDRHDDLDSYHTAQPGDKVLIRYADNVEYYNPDTGEVYAEQEIIQGNHPYRTRPVGGRLVEYEVAAVVELPAEFGYRYFVSGEYIMNAETFKEHSGMDSIMYYAFDMEETEGTQTKGNSGAGSGEYNNESPVSRMESYLADCTASAGVPYAYESKALFEAEFESLRSMYVICGGVLSFIVGLVGVLNFVNVIITGILSRKRELAVLQSVGMTDKQLKSMLILEGLYYELGAVAAAFLLTFLSAPLAFQVMEGMFWFFTYRFTVMPVLAVAPVFALLGAAVPLGACRYMTRKPMVERLREAE